MSKIHSHDKIFKHQPENGNCCDAPVKAPQKNHDPNDNRSLK